MAIRIDDDFMFLEIAGRVIASGLEALPLTFRFFVPFREV
jgi:hypothetical protein